MALESDGATASLPQQSTPSTSKTSDNSGSSPLKSVLVCLAERKREVSFTCQGNELEALSVAVCEVYSDVLKGDENLIFQVKREEWSGEFTDLVCDPVPDRAVLMVVIENAGPNKVVSTRLT